MLLATLFHPFETSPACDALSPPIAHHAHRLRHRRGLPAGLWGRSPRRCLHTRRSVSASGCVSDEVRTVHFKHIVNMHVHIIHHIVYRAHSSSCFVRRVLLSVIRPAYIAPYIHPSELYICLPFAYAVLTSGKCSKLQYGANCTVLMASCTKPGSSKAVMSAMVVSPCKPTSANKTLPVKVLADGSLACAQKISTRATTGELRMNRGGARSCLAGEVRFC